MLAVYRNQGLCSSAHLEHVGEVPTPAPPNPLWFGRVAFVLIFGCQTGRVALLLIFGCQTGRAALVLIFGCQTGRVAFYFIPNSVLPPQSTIVCHPLKLGRK